MTKSLAAPVTVLAVSMALGFAPRADAALMLSADVSGTLFSCVDQASCDTNVAVGTLQVPALPAPRSPSMASTSSGH